jgi:multidrug efflux pump subunit AcrB
VLQTLVAEVYGPDYKGQTELAAQIKNIFQETPGVVDVDWYVEDPQNKYDMKVDLDKAALQGVSAAEVTWTVQIGLSGASAGLLHDPASREDVPIEVRLSRPDRSRIEDLENLKLPTPSGGQVPLREVTSIRETAIDQSVYRKNLRPVVYVTGDVAGEIESPVYAILKMSDAIDKIQLPDGYHVKQYSGTTLPESTDRFSMKWDGEWHITVEVFRDLGLAFAAVLVLIYILVVGWFKSFKTPLVIMAPIPLTLVGILPAHALMGAFFTATSMIGFIAGAGIIVRNSIILVDFIELRRSHGMSLEEAVVDAGAVRFCPMLLTAAAVVVGASVILLDPIFQGLAISLMAGEVASTVLSRMTVPVLYYLSERGGARAVPPVGNNLVSAADSRTGDCQKCLTAKVRSASGVATRHRGRHGALLIRRSVFAKLKRPWFAGGTINFASVQGQAHVLSPNEAAFEDGTLNYLFDPRRRNWSVPHPDDRHRNDRRTCPLPDRMASG